MIGKFIVFEGLSGSGKGTQLTRLASYLYGHKLLEVLTTREPTTGKFGTQVRDLRAEHKRAGIPPESRARDYLTLYTQDTKEHCQQLIVPSLKQGVTVLCDRYYHSRLTYQVLQGVPFEAVLQIQRTSDILVPDLVIILDIDPARAIARIDLRGDRSQLEYLGFMRELRDRYLSLPEALPEERIRVIDASRSIEAISLDIVSEVEAAFG